MVVPGESEGIGMILSLSRSSGISHPPEENVHVDTTTVSYALDPDEKPQRDANEVSRIQGCPENV